MWCNILHGLKATRMPSNDAPTIMKCVLLKFLGAIRHKEKISHLSHYIYHEMSGLYRIHTTHDSFCGIYKHDIFPSFPMAHENFDMCNGTVVYATILTESVQKTISRQEVLLLRRTQNYPSAREADKFTMH